MPPILLRDIIAAADPDVVGRLAGGTAFRWIERNSRDVQPGDCFLAVTGERFDGHAFVSDAAERGAVAAIVRRDWAERCADPPLPLLVVDDPVIALQRIAAERRRSLTVEIVGVTGSIGKTSTKEVIAAVLGERFLTYRSPGNMNSEIGLPLSILEIEREIDVAVLEMGGAYAMGELALLATIARPRVAVVTNVHPVHLERMGTIEAIAETKAELVRAIPPDGVAVLNGDDDRVRAMAGLCAGRVITYGLRLDNELRAEDVQTFGANGVGFRLSYLGTHWDLRLPLVGVHAVELALSAVAVGLAFDLTIDDLIPGLAKRDAQVRLLDRPGPRGSRLIDDTYNASAPSVLSALRLLAETEADRRIAVLGDMRELGAASEWHHRTVGEAVAGVADLLVTFGDLATTIADAALAAGGHVDARPLHVQSFELDQRPALIEFLLAQLREGDVALLKGSRGLEMETIVDALTPAETPSLSAE